MKFLMRLDGEGSGGGYSGSTIDENFNFRMETETLATKLENIIKYGEDFQTALTELSDYFGASANLWKGADASSLAEAVPAPVAEMNKRKQEIDNLCKVAKELRRVIDKGQGDLASNVKTALKGFDGGAS